MFIMCIGIFLARIVDVSLGTVRTMFFVKGKTTIASLIAFFEVFIWFMVAREALNVEISSLWVPIAYSLGYATGTFIGSYISNNFIKGLVCVQVITKKSSKLVDTIREKGYGVSIVDLKNDYDDVKKEMLMIEIQKRSLKKIIDLIKKHDASAFIMVNETKLIQNGLIK